MINEDEVVGKISKEDAQELEQKMKALIITVHDISSKISKGQPEMFLINAYSLLGNAIADILKGNHEALLQATQDATEDEKKKRKTQGTVAG